MTPLDQVPRCSKGCCFYVQAQLESHNHLHMRIDDKIIKNLQHQMDSL